jgi:hypothetical protein
MMRDEEIFTEYSDIPDIPENVSGISSHLWLISSFGILSESKFSVEKYSASKFDYLLENIHSRVLSSVSSKTIISSLVILLLKSLNNI